MANVTVQSFIHAELNGLVWIGLRSGAEHIGTIDEVHDHCVILACRLRAPTAAETEHHWVAIDRGEIVSFAWLSGES